MNINILFFGKLADIANKELGVNQFKLGIATLSTGDSSNSSDIESIKTHIQQKSLTLYSSIQEKGVLIAVNQEMKKQNCIVNTGDEVAFMSPLSGG